MGSQRETTTDTEKMHSKTASAGRKYASAVLFLAIFVAGRGTHADLQSGGMVPWRIERDILRFQAVATDNVMKLLAIRPGMTILDIGAGTGQFAYEFAARMDGTGTVYATDSNPACVEYLRKEAAGRGLSAVRPVLVTKDGIDPFYGKHRYDLITVFHIAMAYEDKGDYFRELRGYLADGGRLVLILYKIPTPFSPGDFTDDFRGLIAELMREPSGSPYSGILRDSTRQRIRNHPATERPDDLKRAVADDFNEILLSAGFAGRFFKGSAHREQLEFSPDERRYADWVLAPYRTADIRSKQLKLRSIPEDRMIATINKLLVLQRYRRYLKRDGMFVSGFAPPIEAAFDKAGYKVEGRYPDLIPFEDMIVFSKQPKGSSAP